MKAKVRFEPDHQEVEVEIGCTIEEAARSGGVRLEESFCGGKGTCGKCRVVVRGAVSEPSGVEKKVLAPGLLTEGIRLACQAQVRGDLTVVTAPDLMNVILTEGEVGRVDFDPVVRKHYLEIPEPSLEDQRSDFHRLRDAVGRDLDPSLEVVRKIPETLRAGGFRVTAVLRGDLLMDLEPGDTTCQVYGVAFDVGTTTVVGYLWDLGQGRHLATASAMNPQASFGADVISRINYTMENKDGLEDLHQAVVGVMNEIIDDLVQEAEVLRRDIYEVTVVGNTCMHHLFFKISPKYLALAPYVMAWKDPLSAPAREAGLQVNPGAVVYYLPNIAGFVGADTVGVLLATGLDRTQKVKLVVDLGTNGEIVLGWAEEMLACSTAAGPAFEGGQISCGMRAAQGAIDHVRWDSEHGLQVSTIGGGFPRGICGSGLVDAVAVMLRAGVLDTSGRILDPADVPEGAARYVVKGERGNEFVLSQGGPDGRGRVTLTQGDIRQVQLAKGAIYAGTRVLMEELGIEIGEISEVLLAGAMGNYFDKESARTIGLVPALPVERIRSVGNGAGAGAQMALCSIKERRRAEEIARKVQHVVLSKSPRFNQEFMEAMFFPEPVERHGKGTRQSTGIR